MIDEVVDGPIRVIDRIEPIGAWDRIEIERYPMPGCRTQGRRLLLVLTRMQPAIGVLAIDPFDRRAAHNE